ncbi:cytochrome P450 [Dactylosporangium matsuzakiense]|uniref:Cytochrome P450 n=1 Tax=Dactylosporangium matsuzakiense TaxID=53360 RepID=A0A9W6KL92_9ACTN|nr:cytochrome P450 [Dactylosporangium matsuzakiense]UWZ45909.1 cytochrome P450 [Dactylosporangium matsuzakiense]GLL02925.1 cytochrome P450 [Dactylosporangium matsuzakiense]
MTQTQQPPLEHMPTRRSCPFDPPDEFAAIRAEAPIARMTYPDGATGWLVSSYELAREVLVHPQVSARHELRNMPVPFPVKLGPAAPGLFFGMDPPQHTRYRKPLAKAFTATQAAAYEPIIERITEDCLDELEAAGSPADLVALFAMPLPIRVISHLVGGDAAVTAEFQRLRVPVLTPGTPMDEIRAAVGRTDALMHELVAAKRAEPGGDVLSTLITDGQFSDVELANIALQILGAGHETTVHMFALGTFLLLQHDELRAAFDVDGYADCSAVDELLRYLSITQFITRAALDDLEIGGERIAKGEPITISLAAANRDGRRFDDPDTFDPARPRNFHLTFGHGVHKCLGNHLASTELRIGLPALLRRFPKLRLEIDPAEVQTRAAMTTYGVHSLPVGW